MNFFRRYIIYFIAIIILAVSIPFILPLLKGDKEETTTIPDDTSQTSKPLVAFPEFNADSAYFFIQKQVSFGPRVPGSKAQKECAEWLKKQLSEYCDTAYIQQTTVTAWDGKKFPCFNVIGSINPTSSKRILLTCHWDARPWADQQDPGSTTPIDAANDGASGAGVWIEIARMLKTQNTETGIDFVFFDVEDYGKSGYNNSYCLGSQYWSANPHIPGYKASFGINLDMVGAKNARFHPEGYSVQYADWVKQMVWRAAQQTGSEAYFPLQTIGQITDDHYYVNSIAGIPMVDVIDYDSNNEHGFGDYWHTQNDNMKIIDKATLYAVGKTMAFVIYNY